MKRSLTVIAVVVAALAGGGFWYVQSKLPTRQGQVALATLQGPVTVRYDERGVPHIRAGNQADMYRALGYVQAQDRLLDGNHAPSRAGRAGRSAGAKAGRYRQVVSQPADP